MRTDIDQPRVPDRYSWLIPTFVGLAGFALYIPSLGHELLVSWDDNRYITENPWILQPTLDSVVRILTQFHFGAYLPVTMLSYAADSWVWGGRAVGFHATNVWLHAINGVLVYLLVMALTGCRRAGVITAILFLVHPIQVETVSWVSQRKTLLSTMFFLATFLIHRKSQESSRAGTRLFWYVGEISSFLLAVLSKPIVVGGPIVLFLSDVIHDRRPVFRSALRVVPHALVSLAGAALILKAHAQVGGIKERLGDGWMDFVLLELRVLFDYVASLAAPFNLDCNYIYTMEWIRSSPAALGGGVLILIGVAIFVLRHHLGRPLGLLAVLWVVIFMLPVANIVPIAIQRTDRYLYIPCILIFAVIGSLLVDAWDRTGSVYRRYALVAVSAGALSVCALVTIQRQAVWHDSARLWASHLEHHPTSQTGLLNRAVYFWRHNRIPEAEFYFQELARVFPNFVKSHQFLGRVAYLKKDYAESARFFRQAEAIESNPEILRMLGLSLFNLGLNSSESGDYSKALLYYQEAVRSLPGEPPLYNNIGFALQESGKPAQAVEAYRKAITLKPDYVKALINMAKSLVLLGQHAQAQEALGRAIRIEPSSQAARDLFLQINRPQSRISGSPQEPESPEIENPSSGSVTAR